MCRKMLGNLFQKVAAGRFSSSLWPLQISIRPQAASFMMLYPMFITNNAINDIFWLQWSVTSISAYRDTMAKEEVEEMDGWIEI